MERTNPKIGWLDILWLVFLVGLALLPPIREIHKQFILAAFGGFQLLESRLVAWLPDRGRVYSVLIKILLATLLLGHTGELSINSVYYPIYYVPVVTAAIFYGPLGTFLWTAVASLSYCYYLIPAHLEGYELSSTGEVTLAVRILFFFLAAMLLNRFVDENRGQVRRLRALSEDLAETNRRLQQAQDDARRAERLAALGRLSAGLAHEIRNPLGVIKGSAEMLHRKLGAEPAIAAELAGYISSEVNRLNALVARFLAFAKPSRLEFRPMDVAVVVDRALETLRAQFPDAPVTVERDFAPGLPPIQADEQLCEQVFVNLALNAYQAMLPDGGKLSVTLSLSQGAGRQPGVGIAFADSGPGVPVELREQIFNPFVTSKKDGVGLGLAIVAKIVDDHRGTIRLETECGHGACFHVFLPLAPRS